MNIMQVFVAVTFVVQMAGLLLGCVVMLNCIVALLFGI